jgi:hypothetical protein
MRTLATTLAEAWLGLLIAVAPAARSEGGSGLTSEDPPEKPAEQAESLRMSPGVVCRTIDGYEKYKRLRGAAQTSEEKLLVYVRPFGYKTELVDGQYQAHLVPDLQIRKRGATAIVREKKKAFEYKPKSPEPPQFVYLKHIISLKGLPPGDYDLVIILHDEVAKGSTATQVVKFRIVPTADPAQVDQAIADEIQVDAPACPCPCPCPCGS